MKYRQTGNQWVVRLDRGERLVETLHRFLAEHHITGGYVWGIGSITDVELGYYDVNAKEYLRRQFTDVYELLSLQGNITVVEGKPFLHAHVLLSGGDYGAFGGHLFEARVRATVEAYLQPWELEIGRALNEDVGLKLWQFKAE